MNRVNESAYTSYTPYTPRRASRLSSRLQAASQQSWRTWAVLQFGKHQGKTLPQVLFIDPDWFFWATETGVFNNRPELYRQATELNYKARNIRIPASEGGQLVVEYYIHAPTGKFARFEIVPANREPHAGSSPAFRSEVIDMSVPRRIAPYDKVGGKLLVSSLKKTLFGSYGKRITKGYCEAFFQDSGNFA